MSGARGSVRWPPPPNRQTWLARSLTLALRLPNFPLGGQQPIQQASQPSARGWRRTRWDPAKPRHAKYPSWALSHDVPERSRPIARLHQPRRVSVRVSCADDATELIKAAGKAVAGAQQSAPSLPITLNDPAIDSRCCAWQISCVLLEMMLLKFNYIRPARPSRSARPSSTRRRRR
jgi:hypothetical protein